MAFKIADIDYETQERLMAMLPQMLIVLVNRNGGHIDVPVEEVNDTGEFVLAMGCENNIFSFTVYNKKDL